MLIKHLDICCLLIVLLLAQHVNAETIEETAVSEVLVDRKTLTENTSQIGSNKFIMHEEAQIFETNENASKSLSLGISLLQMSGTQNFQQIGALNLEDFGSRPRYTLSFDYYWPVLNNKIFSTSAIRFWTSYARHGANIKMPSRLNSMPVDAHHSHWGFGYVGARQIWTNHYIEMSLGPAYMDRWFTSSMDSLSARAGELGYFLSSHWRWNCFNNSGLVVGAKYLSSPVESTVDWPGFNMEVGLFRSF